MTGHAEDTADGPVVLRLHGSRWAWIAGAMWLGMAAVGVVAAPLLVLETFSEGRPRESRGLMIVGQILAAPAFAVIWMLCDDAGRRLVRPRRGRISLQEDRLVIHDRWMLRAPLEIVRVDIKAIRRLPRLPYREYTGFAGDSGRALGESGALLDWWTIPNGVIHLNAERRFTEAIRTIRSNTPLQPINRGRRADALLVRFAEPDAAFDLLDEWLMTSRSGGKRSRRAPSDLLGCFAVGMLWLAGITGTVLVCVGHALGAPG